MTFSRDCRPPSPGGEPPDLFLINHQFFGQFAARDVLDPLGPRLETSSVLQLEDLFPQASTPSVSAAS